MGEWDRMGGGLRTNVRKCAMKSDLSAIIIYFHVLMSLSMINHIN